MPTPDFSINYNAQPNYPTGNYGLPLQNNYTPCYPPQNNAYCSSTVTQPPPQSNQYGSNLYPNPASQNIYPNLQQVLFFQKNLQNLASFFHCRITNT
jgi:hypothetical protein